MLMLDLQKYNFFIHRMYNVYTVVNYWPVVGCFIDLGNCPLYFVVIRVPLKFRAIQLTIQIYIYVY